VLYNSSSVFKFHVSTNADRPCSRPSLYRGSPARSNNAQVIIMDRLTEREREIARLAVTPGTLAAPASDDDALDWRRVGEPESWMGLRAESAMAYRSNAVAVPGGEPPPNRLARCLPRSLLSLFRR
jgi:hypothetical protein